MERTDRAGLHRQPLAATEREDLADQGDQFLADQVPVRPDEPTHHAGDRPGGGYPGILFRRHVRYGPDGVDDCPKGGWEDVPS